MTGTSITSSSGPAEFLTEINIFVVTLMPSVVSFRKRTRTAAHDSSAEGINSSSTNLLEDAARSTTTGESERDRITISSPREPERSDVRSS